MHRKPLGSSFTSSFDWRGETPELHDALVSRAGTWYRVIGVQEKENPAKVGLTLERIAAPRVRAGEVQWEDGYLGSVFEFEWYPRSPRALL